MSSFKRFNFEFNSEQLRVFLYRNEIWFIAEDICNILSIKDEKGLLESTPDNNKDIFGIPDMWGYMRGKNAINKTAVLETLSKEDETCSFEVWLEKEVFPTLSKYLT